LLLSDLWHVPVGAVQVHQVQCLVQTQQLLHLLNKLAAKATITCRCCWWLH
jgi:hypothetical protein